MNNLVKVQAVESKYPGRVVFKQATTKNPTQPEILLYTEDSVRYITDEINDLCIVGGNAVSFESLLFISLPDIISDELGSVADAWLPTHIRRGMEDFTSRGVINCSNYETFDANYVIEFLPKKTSPMHQGDIVLSKLPVDNNVELLTKVSSEYLNELIDEARSSDMNRYETYLLVHDTLFSKLSLDVSFEDFGMLVPNIFNFVINNLNEK